MAKPRERPLAWHLAALCFALALPILFLIGMLTWSHAEAEHTRIEQDAVKSAHDVVAATDRELAGLIATTKVLAVSQSLQTGDLAAFDAQARNVHREIGINVVLRNRESKQVVNTRLPRGAPLPSNIDKESDLAVLTPREYEVLKYLVGGKSNKEIAAKLGISPRTVEFHRAHIMEKAGAKRLPELVRIWLGAQAIPELQHTDFTELNSLSRS